MENTAPFADRRLQLERISGIKILPKPIVELQTKGAV